MAKYKIADVVVEMNQKFSESAYWYEPYLYDGEEEPEFSVDASDEEINYFVTEGVGITPPIAENMVLCNKFNRRLMRFYGSYIHSSAILFDGKAYLFSAPSQTGKSTHTKKWLNRFGDRVKIINDDKPSFRFIDGKCIIYGTPFAGGTDVQKNISAQLGALVFIERAEENSLEKLTASKAVGLLISQSPGRANEKVGDRQLEMFSMLLSRYPVYLLRCNMDDSAVDTALGIIQS